MQSLVDVPAQERTDYTPDLTDIKLEGSKQPKKMTGLSMFESGKMAQLTHVSCKANQVDVPVVLYAKVTLTTHHSPVHLFTDL
jgi:hypothetical protein